MNQAKLETDMKIISEIDTSFNTDNSEEVKIKKGPRGLTRKRTQIV